MLNDSAGGQRVGYSCEADSEETEMTLYRDYSGMVFLSVPLPENAGPDVELTVNNRIQKSDIVKRCGTARLESTLEVTERTTLRIRSRYLETAK